MIPPETVKSLDVSIGDIFAELNKLDPHIGDLAIANARLNKYAAALEEAYSDDQKADAANIAGITEIIPKLEDD